jgi:hypothetical protein
MGQQVCDAMAWFVRWALVAVYLPKCAHDLLIYLRRLANGEGFP